MKLPPKVIEAAENYALAWGSVPRTDLASYVPGLIEVVVAAQRAVDAAKCRAFQVPSEITVSIGREHWESDPEGAAEAVAASVRTELAAAIQKGEPDAR